MNYSRGGQVKNLVRLGLIAVLASCGTSAKSEVRPAPATGAAPGGCPYATDNGCAAANHNGSFQNTSLLTSAQQSGQTSLLPKHPMTFNIPGVDYPIGPDKTLTPQDPRTIKKTASTPCAYTGTGSSAPPNDYVGCFGAGTFPNAILNNYDFSGTKIGKAPLGLYINSDAGTGSKITITNSYFSIPSGDSKAIGWGQPDGGNWSIVFKNNQCDGSRVTPSSQFCFGNDIDTPGTTFDAEYNAFTNQGVGRVGGGFRYMATTWRYNFIQGLNDILTNNHGEVELRTCSHGGCKSSEDYEGNFIVWNSTARGSNNNATFFPSTGDSNGLILTSTKFVNNVIVTNTAGSPATPTSGHQIGQVLFGMRASSLGDVTITGNWMDATGATGCGVNGVTSGGDSVTASTSGNTLTITETSSSFNNNPIEPGWKIFHSGFVAATITAFGTGRGHLGTYTFDGAPQTLGSDGAWTVVPGFTSATLTGNYNLADPSHTGTPTPVGFRGPTMRETTCLGAHN